MREEGVIRNMIKLSRILLGTALGIALFTLFSKGKEPPNKALNDCLVYASTYDADRGAEIRDHCIAVREEMR